MPRVIRSVRDLEPGMFVYHNSATKWIGYIGEDERAYCARFSSGGWPTRLIPITGYTSWHLHEQPVMYALEPGDRDYDECWRRLAISALTSDSED